MKYFFWIFVLFPGYLFSQNQLTILEEDEYSMLIEVKFEKGNFSYMNTPYGNEARIVLPDGVNTMKEGAPDLPQKSFSLIIPDDKKVRAEIIDRQTELISNVSILPSRGKILQDQAPESVPYIRGKEFAEDAFYPANSFDLGKPYILRDYRGVAVHFYPYQYNPMTRTLDYTSRMVLRLVFENGEADNALERSQTAKPTQAWNNIYQNHFQNYKNGTRYSPIDEDGTMLIVCPNKYLSALPDFIEWKERKGIKIILVDADTLNGGADENNLYAFIGNMYNLYQIHYLLIVGDDTDIPARNHTYQISGLFGPSDIAYAYQAGNDHYPEFSVGRFSGQNLSDIQVQVNRTLSYEKTPNTGSVWMQTQLGMASNQGPGWQNLYDMEHIHRIIDSNVNVYTYTQSFEMYDGSQGGLDMAGNPTNTMVVNAINGGLGLMNYCGHGSTDAFTTSGFSTSDVNALTNTGGKWPFIISTACLQGNLVSNYCLGEKLLAAKNGSNAPTGAIGSLMCSILQAWDPPMLGQSEMNAIIRKEVNGVNVSTLGTIVNNGTMIVLDEYNSVSDPHGGDEIMDTWVLFGDPSCVLYTKNEGSLVCTHSSVIGKNATSFSVNCTEDDALISLFYQGKYLASSRSQGGVANFTFPAITVMDTVWITATKQNFIPYNGFAEVVVYPDGIDELEKEGLSVYPNPARDFIYIQSIYKNIQAVELFTLEGKRVGSYQDKVHLQGVPPGEYILKVYLNNGRVAQSKILKYPH